MAHPGSHDGRSQTRGVRRPVIRLRQMVPRGPRACADPAVQRKRDLSSWTLGGSDHYLFSQTRGYASVLDHGGAKRCPGEADVMSNKPVASESGKPAARASRGRPRKDKSSAPPPQERGGGIQSLERASALLDAVAAKPDGISLAELSTKVGLHTSTAFHLVKTLVALGFVAQNADTKRYRIGSRIFLLAAGALQESTLLAFATPILERLSVDTGEASHLAIRSGHDIIVVARTAATGLLTLSDRTGALRPPHATALGKVLMAAMDDAELERMVNAIERPRFTAATITEPEALLAEIEQVRADGIAHDRGELDSDVRCMAVPVLDFAGRTYAAMGISAPAWRMAPAALEEKARILKASADRLSSLLGGAAPHARPAGP